MGNAFFAKMNMKKKAVAPIGAVGAPMVPMHPKMVAAIKASPKGVLPPGLARYLAAKKANKKGGK